MKIFVVVGFNPMKSIRITMSLILILLGQIIFAQQDASKKPPVERIYPAPIIYEKLLLIISSVSEGDVAAIIFDKELGNGPELRGVEYSFRYFFSKANKEARGKGIVCEKVKYKKTKNPSITEVIDEGSILTIKAHSLQIEWSHWKPGAGWVYYDPKKVRVQIATATDFEKLDLKQFVIQNQIER